MTIKNSASQAVLTVRRHIRGGSRIPEREKIALYYSLNDRFLLQNIVSFTGLFANETYNFKEPTCRSHPIAKILPRWRSLA